VNKNWRTVKIKSSDQKDTAAMRRKKVPKYSGATKKNETSKERRRSAKKKKEKSLWGKRGGEKFRINRQHKEGTVIGVEALQT